MRFVVDESSWRFDGFALSDCIEALEAVLDQLDLAREQGITACYSEDLFNIPVWQDKILYDLYLTDSPFSIPGETLERITAIFSGLPKWQDCDKEWPSTFDVQINKMASEYAPSIAWAHKQTVESPANAIACVVMPIARSIGSCDVSVDGETACLWFVADRRSNCNFFRWLIVEATKNPSEMEKLSGFAFPTLDFADGAFNGIKDMSKPYRDLVNPLVHHLGALADHGERIFRGARDRVEAEFGALGVNISDENGNTKSDRNARKDRTIVIDGAEVVFWWHTKLELHQDRIHLNPDQIPSGNKLLVGIFCRHLK